MYNNVVETRKFKRHNGFDIDNHINKNTQDINTELRLPETLQIVIEPLTAIGKHTKDSIVQENHCNSHN